jgi:hypothetical protein
MKTHALPLRRFAALLIVTAAAAALASCGRTVNRLTPPVTGAATWNNTISHMLADRSEGTQPTGCTSCHHAGTNLPDWTDYQTVVDYAPIIRNQLQPAGAMRQFLKPGEPEVVIGWIDSGLPRE